MKKALAVAQDIGSGDKPLDCRVFPTTLIESLAISKSMGVGNGGLDLLVKAQAATLRWW